MRTNIRQGSAFDSGRFEWSQFPGCGPAAEVFGVLTDQHLLELGCGIGSNAAALARGGAMVHGVDVAADIIVQARILFAKLEPELTFTSRSAEDFLTDSSRLFDCVYSIFGAVGFVDPHVLLPMVRRCLVPNGRLIFSVRHPEWDGAVAPPQRGRVVRQILPVTAGTVRRFEFSRTGWSKTLTRYGFRVDQMLDLRAPLRHSPGRTQRAADPPCCLLVASSAT